ncbi:hypothetical protein IFM89_019028 [Coptis chinensis]|uniref:Pentatricopeptide repeat-containing protein-mitochondrial domain-containing protein n=1 Tax=Coptis chinensis TaxID=261450 RepID=A0A835HE44_9MAGN|nr:hypothetical protein IFM89_019028 [Coptis chinensis]
MPSTTKTTLLLKTRLLTPSKLHRISNPSSFYYVQNPSFCSVPISPQPPTTENGLGPVPEEDKVFQRVPRGKLPNREKIEDTICRMMANREWTTRLQHSIRNVCPRFDHSIVWNILHGARKADHALQFFRWVEKTGYRPDNSTTLKIIEILGRASKLNHARCILFDMPKKGLQYDEELFVVLIDSYGKAGIVQESVKIFQKMKELNVERTIKSYDALFKVILRRGRVLMAKRYFNAMLREEMVKYGIKPNDVTYSTLLPGLCDAEKMPEAQKFVKEMVERHIAPKDNSIFLKLIASQCKSGNLDWAASVLKGMIRLSIPTEAAHYGVLIESFCKSRVYDKAINLLDKVIEKEILLSTRSSSEMEPSAFNPMIEYLCNNGQTEKAETFFRQLMKTGVQDPVAFNNLLRGHSEEGTPESAVEILKIMTRRKVPIEADAYRSIILCLLRKGEPADAKAMLDGMIESGHLPDSDMFRMVMESLFNDGRVQTASRVMKSMIEKGVKEHMDLVAKILEALLMRGHVEEALGRIELLMDNDCIPDFDNLLAVLCDKEKTIAALRLLDFGLERDYNISFSSCDKVLDTLVAAGKTLNAYSILCKIMEKGGVKDLSSRDELIRTLNAEGNTKQADILSRMIMGGEETKKRKKVKAHT